MRVVFKYTGSKKSKKPMVLDAKKQLWLMRMVLGEGGKGCTYEKAEVLCRAIINRWFLWPGARWYPTFILMMRAFSQPINPRWMTGGDLAKKWVGRKAASKERLARRAWVCSRKKHQIPRIIRNAVENVARGKLSYPVALRNLERRRISNWASLPSTPTKHPWGADVDGDWFFEDNNLRDGKVTIYFDKGEEI